MTKPIRLTLHDIARQVDAPIEQVNKVILGQPGVSEEFRRRVFAAMEAAGLMRMTPAATSGTIGIVFPGTLDGDYVTGVVHGASETARRHGYAATLYLESSGREDELLRILEQDSCLGIIAVVPDNYSRLLELCRQQQREYVLVDYQGDDDLSQALTVEVHNRQSMIDVMAHLFSLGHRRIAFLTGQLRHASARQRLQGYQDALAAASIPVDTTLIKEGNWFHERGCELALELLALPDPPTAIVASNDLMAFGAMQAARQLNLNVGVDVSITGFDDIQMAATVTPSLTTVRQPMLELGQAAVELLIDHVAGQRQTERHLALATELIVRQSTGPAPR